MWRFGRVEFRSLIGILLAIGMISAWLAAHIFVVWFLHAPAHTIVAILCGLALVWLSVGLFITAHDAMHGTVLPGMTRWNTAIGGLALMLFAGFSWRRLIVKHMAHHRFPGTADDPDFDDGGALQWYSEFVQEYFGWREFFLLGASVILYAFVLGPRWPYVAFWSVPSILASIQLFWFGTYLTHRPGALPFSDCHNARSVHMNNVLSLLSCFHFGGYHHEHHLHPSVPWWRLPTTRVREQRGWKPRG